MGLRVIFVLLESSGEFDDRARYRNRILRQRTDPSSRYDRRTRYNALGYPHEYSSERRNLIFVAYSVRNFLDSGMNNPVDKTRR